jgi:phage repressor protein C with HTH and peptisase S24 domain
MTISWATAYINRLKEGKTVSFRPRGNSMSPKINSGELCTVSPIDPTTLSIGDIVLCEVGRKQYLHLVKDIKDNKYQIGNNRGYINGWIGPNCIFGKLITIYS